VVMVDALQLPICAMLRRDVNLHIRLCVLTAYVRLPMLLVSMRGLDAQLICTSVTTVGVPPTLPHALLSLFTLVMDVLSRLVRILTGAGTVNVLQVLTLVQFLKVATVATTQHQIAPFARRLVLQAKCDVLMVLAILSLHARQRRGAI
jgi:hypothetical protein